MSKRYGVSSTSTTTAVPKRSGSAAGVPVPSMMTRVREGAETVWAAVGPALPIMSATTSSMTASTARARGQCGGGSASLIMRAAADAAFLSVIPEQ